MKLYSSDRVGYTLDLVKLGILTFLFSLFAFVLAALYTTVAINIIELFTKQNFHSYYHFCKSDGNNISKMVIAITFSIFFELLLRLVDFLVFKFNGEKFFYCAYGRQLRVLFAIINLFIFVYSMYSEEIHVLFLISSNFSAWSFVTAITTGNTLSEYDEIYSNVLTNVESVVEYIYDEQRYYIRNKSYHDRYYRDTDNSIAMLLNSIIELEYNDGQDKSDTIEMLSEWKKSRSELHNYLYLLEFEYCRLYRSTVFQKLMRDSGLTKEDLSHLTDIDLKDIEYYENGGHISKDNIKLLSKIFEVPKNTFEIKPVSKSFILE